MTNKPAHATGYSPVDTERCRRTCLQLATVLGDLLDEIVVVGGLVPPLIIDQQNLPAGAEPHCGTADVDLGLSISLLDDERYQALRERLLNAGFEPDTNDRDRLTRQRWVRTGPGTAALVDFLIEPSPSGAAIGSLQDLDKDFAAVVAEALPLAFIDRIKVPLKGLTLDAEATQRSIWVCGPGAFVVMKAIAFDNRGEKKDAYDLYYTLRNYGQGPASIAEAIAPLLGSECVPRALGIIRRDFCATDAPGAQRVAAFLASTGDETLLADIAGHGRTLLRHLEQPHSQDSDP